jgi:hypothetical protein
VDGRAAVIVSSAAVATSTIRARAGWALLAAAALSGTAGRAVGAEAMSVSLDYEVAPPLADCPSAADFRREVARQLGRDPFRDAGSRRLLVRLYTADGRLGGRIEWRDPQGEWEGERTFSSKNESCAAMARAIGLATAIQIELLATLGGAPAPEPEPPDVVEEEAPPSPVRAVVQSAELGRPVTPAEPLFAVSLGVGAVRDFGDAPGFAVPSVALALGRPHVLAVRLTASGLGPGADVSGLEGSAALDRFLGTLEVLRSFRRDGRIQPLLAAGVGVQDVEIRGTSAMPSLAAAHAGHRVSGLVTAGGGVGFALARRLSLLLEGDALFFRPSVTVKVGATTAAYMDGVALFIHGGLLARF